MSVKGQHRVTLAKRNADRHGQTHLNHRTGHRVMRKAEKMVTNLFLHFFVFVFVAGKGNQCFFSRGEHTGNFISGKGGRLQIRLGLMFKDWRILSYREGVLHLGVCVRLLVCFWSIREYQLPPANLSLLLPLRNMSRIPPRI